MLMLKMINQLLICIKIGN